MRRGRHAPGGPSTIAWGRDQTDPELDIILMDDKSQSASSVLGFVLDPPNGGHPQTLVIVRTFPGLAANLAFPSLAGPQ